jgi:hypothetical protein
LGNPTADSAKSPGRPVGGGGRSVTTCSLFRSNKKGGFDIVFLFHVDLGI